MTKTLTVWWGDAVVGALGMDRHGAMRFAYEETWLANSSASALSVSLPKRREAFRPGECRPFFEGLLPEGAQRDAVGAALGTSPGNVFGLLEGVGGEVAGAIALLPADEAPVGPAPSAEPTGVLSDSELREIVEKVEIQPLLVGEKGLRLSLAGVQPKLPVVLVGGRVALPKPGQPTTHVLKPPVARFAATTENEAFSMRLAARIGLAAAPVEILAVAPERVSLLVERYDRRPGADGIVRRLHQEDFCQALGISSDRKYASDGGPGFPQCFELVRRVCSRPAVEVLKLLDAAIFQALIGNADAHGKNYSLLHDEEAVRLAPLYDLLSTVAYPELSPRFAMKIAGRGTLQELRADDWGRFAKSVGISAPFAKRRVRELADLAIERAAAEELAVPGMDPDALAGYAERARNRARQLAKTVR